MVRLLFGLVFAGVLLITAELGLRAAGVQGAYQPEAMGGWRMQTDMDQVHIQGGREPHDFVVSTNSAGLRTDLKKGKGRRKRVAVMGDSNVFGWGVNEDGTLAAGIQAGLRERGVDWELLNAGQPGYSTTQVAWMFEEDVRHYAPDLVIVFLTLHDHNKVLVSDRESLEGAQGSAAVRVALVRHSRIYQSLRELVFPNFDRVQLLPHDDTDEPRVLRASEAERAESFDRMRERLDGWWGELALGLLPFYPDLQRPPQANAMPREGVEFARAYAKERGIQLFDVRTCCGPAADVLVFPFDHGHLNADGNRLAGDAVAEALVKGQ